MVLGYPDVYAAGDHVPHGARAPAGRPRGHRRQADRLHAQEGSAPGRRRTAARRSRRGCWSSSAATPSAEADAAAPDSGSTPSKRATDPPSVEGVRRRVGGTEALGGPRVGSRGDRPRPRTPPRPGRAGRTPRSLPNSRRLPARLPRRCSTSSATSAALYGHFGQGCIHCRIDFDLDTVHGIAPVTDVPRPGRRPGRLATAARCRASMATARRAPRC